MEAHALITLGYAALGGCIIGLEREWAQKSAGLRTHMLVSVGAAMFMAASPEHLVDNTRVIQGIATGVGFVGAGAIMKDRNGVLGLTTATSIWIAAAVGTCVAQGNVVAALGGAVLAVATLITLRAVERQIALCKGGRHDHHRS